MIPIVTSQFFINTVEEQQRLDAGGANGPDGYAVFWAVWYRQETADKIKKSELDPNLEKRSRAPNGHYISSQLEMLVENAN